MWLQEGRKIKARVIVWTGLLIAVLCLVVTVQVRSTASDASSSNSTSPATPPPVSLDSFVWVASGKTLTQIDATSNQATQTLLLNNAAIDLAVDPHTGEMWVLVSESLLKFDAQGNLILEQKLDELVAGMGKAEHMVLNPYNTTLWVSADTTLLHVDSDGQLLHQASFSDSMKALALDLDESLWLITETELVHVSAEGKLQARFSLASLHAWTQAPLYLAVEPLGGKLWLASAAELVPLNLNDLTAAPLPITLSVGTVIRGVALDPVTGTLWLATEDRLLAYDRAGDLVNSVDLVAQGVKVDTTLAYDPASQSLWLGDENALAHFSAAGEFIARTALASAPDALGVAAVHIVPSLELVEPNTDAPTNNSVPSVRLGLGAMCNGNACDPGNAYRHKLDIDADLNKEDISGLLTRSGAHTTYTPTTPLPEGVNTLTAQATDAFGHISSVLTTGFTIDTRAPQFVELNPADGSAVDNAEISIQGRVDEPATVILTHPDGETTVGGTPFAFAVTLNEGPNTFGLTARDPAGNETTVSLTITLDTVPPPVPDIGLITISGPDADGKVTVTGGNGSVEANATVIITNTRTGESFTVIADDTGTFSADITAEPGDTFTAVVKDAVGNTSDPLEVALPDSALILHVSPASGVAPLTVTFSLLGGHVPAALTLDLEGDGLIDFTGPSLEGQSFTYAAPGLYRPTVIVTDVQGSRFTASAVVLVEDQGVLDALFQSQWAGMKAALQQSDIQGALQFIAPESRAAYEAMFTELASILATVGTDLGDIQFVEVRENLAEYELLAVENGQTMSYYVEFIRDEEEQWHLKFF